MFKHLKQWLTPQHCLPSPWDSARWSDIPFLALDLELTTLDIEKSNILSLGWVAARHNQIFLDSCCYHIVNTKASLNQSPVIHGLVAEEVDRGVDVAHALERLLPFAQSHVWVFHNTHLDMSVLRKVFAQLKLTVPPIVTIDTLQMEVYQLKKQSPVLAPNAAMLSSCRQRYNLPYAPAHNALDDAMATIELLYAQLNLLDPLNLATLDEFTHSGSIKVFPELSE